jgi:hypothetical protein
VYEGFLHELLCITHCLVQDVLTVQATQKSPKSVMKMLRMAASDRNFLLSTCPFNLSWVVLMKQD